MMIQKSIELYQIMDVGGNVNEKEMPKLSDKDAKAMYQFMLLIRKFDEKCLNLQRQGRCGTYAPVLGQEAAQVGSAYALSREDWLFPTYRESGALIVKGMPLTNLLQYFKGDDRYQKIPQGLNVFPISIPVGSQLPHATGVAWAAKLKKDRIAVLVYFGDGATSEGDFHEAMNFAGVFKLPVVFLCQNNQYAISVPRKKQTASETIAQKAIAYGFDGMQVDGNDVFAVYKVVREALEKAKTGNGPTLIECVTYRRSLHTTSDDPTKYRNEKEVKEWEAKDPLTRLKKFFQRKNLFTEKEEKELMEKAETQVNKAVEDVEKMQPEDPLEMFRYVYESMAWNQEEQMNYLKRYIKK